MFSSVTWIKKILFISLMIYKSRRLVLAHTTQRERPASIKRGKTHRTAECDLYPEKYIF